MDAKYYSCTGLTKGVVTDLLEIEKDKYVLFYKYTVDNQDFKEEMLLQPKQVNKIKHRVYIMIYFNITNPKEHYILDLS